jgi:hypothetical protein
MSATGADPTVGVQFYMQTGSGFTYQALNGTLTADGQFHDLTFPLAAITARDFVDTNGINLSSHASDLVIRVDSVIYSVPEPAAMSLLAAVILAQLAPRRARRSTRI